MRLIRQLFSQAGLRVLALCFSAGVALAQPSISTVVNPANLATFAPNSAAVIYGSNLTSAPCENGLNPAPWPTANCTLQVRLNSTAMPIGFASAGQVNVQIPETFPAGSATITVINSAGQSAPFPIFISATYAPVITGGPVHTAGLPGLSAVNSGNPATLGPADSLTVFGFGFGPTSPGVPAGQLPLGPPFPTTTATPTVLVDGQPAAGAGVVFSGLDVGTPGRYRIDFTLGVDSLAEGDHVLVLQIGGVSTNSVPFVVAGPTVSAVVDGFSYRTTLAPGGAAAIFGADLANGVCPPPPGNAPTLACDAQVLVNGVLASVIFASPTQLYVQFPFGIAPGSATVVVKRPALGWMSKPQNILLSAFSPGLGTVCGCGTGQAASFHLDGSPVGLPSPPSPTASPAVPGETVSVIAGGLGSTTPFVAAGERAPAPPPPLDVVDTPPTMTLDGQPVTVTGAFLQPGSIAQYRVFFTIPPGVLAGDHNLLLNIGGLASQSVTLTTASLAWTVGDQPGPISSVNTFTSTAFGAAIPLGAGINNISALAITPDAKRLYVAPTAGNLWMVDTTTRVATELTGVPSVNQVIVVSPDGRRAFFQSATDTVTVLAIDPFTPATYNTVIASISIPGAHRLALSPDGQRLYVGTSNSIVAVDVSAGSTYATLATVTGLGGPNGISDLKVTPDGSLIYAINRGAYPSMYYSTISVISTTTYAEVASRISANYAVNLAIRPDGKRAYATSLPGGFVMVIDIEPGSGTINSVLATVPAGIGVFGLTTNADGSRLYVASSGTMSLSIMDTTNNTFLDPAAVAGKPYYVVATLPPNTALGANSVAAPVDSTTGQTPVALTFANVQNGGTTTLTTTQSTQPPPSGFQLGSTTYDISTTATFSGPIEVCITYSEVEFPPPTPVVLLHFENDMWVDVTTSLDTGNHIVCGSVESLSPFAPAVSDTTPPLVSPSVAPQPNANGWNKTDVNVTWNTSDPESGIASEVGCDATGFSTETFATDLTCVATNQAGLSSSSSVTVRIDKTPPDAPVLTLSPAANANGWNNTDVAVNFVQTGDLGPVQSGVASCTQTTVGGQTAGTIVSGTCTDLADNVSASTDVLVKIDRVKPRTRSTESTDGANVVVTLNATDALSGVANIQYSLSGAQTLPLQTVSGDSALMTITAAGKTTVTYNATDNAGNVEATKTLVIQNK